MSIHPSSYTIFKDLKPEDKLTLEQTEFLQDTVLKQVNCTLAYAILGYADWIVYVCARYIEDGGIDDLSHIEARINFPDDTDYKLKKKIVDDIYFIIRPILINAQKYKRAYIPEGNFDIGKSVDWMREHCPDANWDIVSKALSVLQKGV